MAPQIDPNLPQADVVVLASLYHDIKKQEQTEAEQNETFANDYVREVVSEFTNDRDAIEQLSASNDKNHANFEPTVFVTWDEKDIPPVINEYLVKPYARFAQKIVRHPVDVVFLTHILLYFSTSVPSAIYLYRHFSWMHGVLHAIYTVWCSGSFTLMMHNHIHNNGVLQKQFYWFDFAFPYILEPLMGHTWDSYYYHHVKHHHVEGNGPDDLSSTIRYQRDELSHFACYVGRFLFFIWLELPLYFMRKGKTTLALKAGTTELLNYVFFYVMATRVNLKATVFVFLIPFSIMRLGLMIGNWGQHALVDEVEPDSDFRSSITLVDVPSNRFCFNDGYHTAHHLNPLRHWRDQPVHFLKSKEAYSNGRALVFHNIDYLMMTLKLMQKDYMYLAACLVPIGDQIGMTQQEIADMLRTKTKRFTEEDIRRKFPRPASQASKSDATLKPNELLMGKRSYLQQPQVMCRKLYQQAAGLLFGVGRPLKEE